MNYATIEDLAKLWRPLTDSEKEKAEELIAEASAKIRIKAKSQGKDFDEIVTDDSDIALIAKGLVCTVVKSAMNTPNDIEGLSQMSMSAGGYSWSGTYSNPNGGIKFTKKDWKSIGLGSQKFGGVDVYGMD